MIKIFENTGEDFSGYFAATAWLEEQGYKVAPMCWPAPTGFAPAEKYHYIAKWYNLSSDDRKHLSGHIQEEGGKDGDFRNGPVTVIVYDNVDKQCNA